jgi:hypothetical protein
MLDNTIAYRTVKLAGTIEKGGISKPDKDGKLTPQTNSAKNRNMRRFIVNSHF